MRTVPNSAVGALQVTSVGAYLRFSLLCEPKQSIAQRGQVAVGHISIDKFM